MGAKKTRKFLTAASALVGAILGSTAQAAPQTDAVAARVQPSNDERRENDFVIAPRPTLQPNQDPVPSHQSHVSHASHDSHASHESHASHSSSSP
jgi:hypothetical protein